MSIKNYKFKIFRVYCSYKINLSYKIVGVEVFFQGSFELFLSLKKVLHKGGQVIEDLNSTIIGSPLENC